MLIQSVLTHYVKDNMVWFYVTINQELLYLISNSPEGPWIAGEKHENFT